MIIRSTLVITFLYDETQYTANTAATVRLEKSQYTLFATVGSSHGSNNVHHAGEWRDR